MIIIMENLKGNDINEEGLQKTVRQCIRMYDKLSGREGVKILFDMKDYCPEPEGMGCLNFDKIFHAEYPQDILAYLSNEKVTNPILKPSFGLSYS